MTRRTLTCIIGLTMMLLLTTSAAAIAATIYAGKGIDDPRAKVRFKKDHGTIKRFTIKRARFSCADGDRFRDGTRVGAMKIRKTRTGKRKFSGHFSNDDGTQTARVRGILAKRGKIRGTFRLLAVFDRGGCDTGRVDWRARRVVRR